MSKRTIVDCISRVLQPSGFLYTKNRWKLATAELEKVVELKKSKFGNQFFINYGFIIKDADLGDLSMHVYTRMSYAEKERNKKIDQVFDLEAPIPDQERETMIKSIIEECLLGDFREVNTTSDLRQYLQKRRSLNDVPLVTKERLGIPLD